MSVVGPFPVTMIRAAFRLFASADGLGSKHETPPIRRDVRHHLERALQARYSLTSIKVELKWRAYDKLEWFQRIIEQVGLWKDSAAPTENRVGRPQMLRRTSHLLCAVMIATCVFTAACGDDGTPASPSGAVLQSLTVVGPSGAGGVILHRNETATGTVTLSTVAPANAVITLQTIGAERNALIVPATVTIGRGSTSVSFSVTVTGSGVSGPAEVTLTATYGGSTQSVVIRLAP